jgi:hypothetical protein
MANPKAYLLWHSQLNYRVDKQLNGWLKISNLTDNEHRLDGANALQANDIPGRGRQWLAGVDWSW